MKKRMAFLSLLFLLGSIRSDRAISAQVDASASEKTVRALDDQERKAVLDRNYAPLEQLWCDQLTVNSPANNVVIGKRNVLSAVQKFGQYSSFERKIEFLRIDDNIAIIMGAETIQPIGDVPLAGKTVQRRFTHIWKKNGETWCVIARHANVVASR